MTPEPSARAPEKIHLVAICGTGMGSFALLLRAAGHEVRGSDANVYPPMSTLLAESGVHVMQGFRPENLAWGPDRIIMGNAVRRTNPEAEAAERSGVRIDSFPSALADLFLNDRRSLVVTGTHGKSTTASILSWCLDHAGRDPSFLVGGVLRNFDATMRLGAGPHFVVEGDEYDTAYFDKASKFLHYRPKAAVMTGVEFDHADIFGSLDEIEAAFIKFAALLPEDGLLVVHEDVPERILVDARCRTERYGTREGAHWRMTDLAAGPDGLTWQVARTGEPLGTVRLPMSGAHNAMNALAVIALLAGEGVAFDAVCAGLRAFEGVKRRQEVIAEARLPGGTVTVVDDFAHHPTAVKTTLEGLRARYPDRRLVALFEPRTATTRRKIFQDRYPEAFDAADVVAVTGVYRAEDIPEGERFDTERLVRDISGRGPEAHHFARADALGAWYERAARGGDLVVMMSNGDFGGLRVRIPAMLAERTRAAGAM